VSERRRIDVAHYPIIGFGPRATLWWSVVLIICVETMTLATTLATYFYLRDNTPEWPVLKLGPIDRAVAAVTVLLLLASTAPMLLADRAAKRGDRAPMTKWLIVTTAIGFAALVPRAFEIVLLPESWFAHAHASIVWVALGLHSFHLLAGVLENVVLLLLFFRGPVQQKHRMDLQANVLYWVFVVVAWIPFYGIIYWDW
jgi:heme/copper-type cytochrome/quinol oxidase subunit 3